MIKVTSGFNLKKTIFFTRWRCHPKNSWNIFQIQITPLLWRSQGPQGCLEKQNCPLSLNLAVWCAKIGPKTQKFKKNIKKPSFFVVFLSFLRFFEYSRIFSAPNCQIPTQWTICFSRHPWRPWGCQSSGVIRIETKISWSGHCGLCLGNYLAQIFVKFWVDWRPF